MRRRGLRGRLSPGDGPWHIDHYTASRATGDDQLTAAVLVGDSFQPDDRGHGTDARRYRLLHGLAAQAHRIGSIELTARASIWPRTFMVPMRAAIEDPACAAPITEARAGLYSRNRAVEQRGQHLLGAEAAEDVHGPIWRGGHVLRRALSWRR